MMVRMKNSSTGEMKELSTGFNWILFLFSGVFGIPLFLRKLNVWGGIFAFLSIIGIFGYILIIGKVLAGLALFYIANIIIFILSIMIGKNGNKLTAKNYLENGWVFVDENGNGVKYAKSKWGIL